MTVPETKKSGNTRRVSFIKNTTLEFPQLWMDVFVVGDKWEQSAFTKMFVQAHCMKAPSLEEADLVVFTGGPDVRPALYGAKAHWSTRPHQTRDLDDFLVYREALKLGIPMFGVCRGAQFIHVMNGGSLYQDVDNHNSVHGIWDTKRRVMISNVSSVHHQMCMPNPDNLAYEVIADSSRATKRVINDDSTVLGNRHDCEAFWYGDICAFGVQGHPEYAGYPGYMQWTLEYIDKLISQNPEVKLVNRQRRLDPLVAKKNLEKFKKTTAYKILNAEARK